MCKEDVSYSSVSKCWTKYGYFIHIAPIINTFFIIDLFSKSLNNLARTPFDSFFCLFLSHFFEERQQKVFQFDIGLIRDKNISNSAMSIQSIFDIIHIKLSQMESAHTFHQIFLYSTSSSNNTIDHSMLCQVSNDFPHSTGRHIGSISQEDSASSLLSILWVTCLFIISFIQGLVRQSPANHAVYYLNCFVQMGCLEPHSGKTFEEFLVINSLIEVISLYNFCLEVFVLGEQLFNLLLNQFRRNYLRFTAHVASTIIKEYQFNTTNSDYLYLKVFDQGILPLSIHHRNREISYYKQQV